MVIAAHTYCIHHNVVLCIQFTTAACTNAAAAAADDDDDDDDNNVCRLLLTFHTKSSALAVITPFKVIQDHRFQYQLKARMPVPIGD